MSAKPELLLQATAEVGEGPIFWEIHFSGLIFQLARFMKQI